MTIISPVFESELKETVYKGKKMVGKIPFLILQH
jgi:hypothetical protein